MEKQFCLFRVEWGSVEIPGLLLVLEVKGPAII